MSLLIFACCFLFSAACVAAPADLLAIDSAFVSGKYEQVELLSLRALQSDSQLTSDETARICLTTGYALIMLDRESDARDYFNRALDAVPTLTLDPVQVSPKFRLVFDEVKAARPAHTKASPPPPAQLALGQAKSARILNLFVPGAGQLQEKKFIKGALFITLQTASTILWISELDKTQTSRADYLAATDESDIRAKYKTYNSHYKNSWTYGISAGAVYVLSQLDLTLFPAKTSSTTLSLIPTPNSFQATLRW